MRRDPIRTVTHGFLWLVAAFLAVQHGMIVKGMIELLNMNDFGKFYYSTRAFLGGTDMYGTSPATFIPVGGGRLMHFWNLNPPHFHLLLLPIAPLPRLVAFGIWGLASAAALAAAWKIISTELPAVRSIDAPVLAVLFLVFSATVTTLVTGQLSWLLMLPMTIAWRNARQGYWTRAGLWLGLCASVKPFLLVFGPYLLFTRRIRATVAMGVVFTAAFAVGLAVFGVEAHRSWLRVVGEMSWPTVWMNGSLLALVHRLGGSTTIWLILLVPLALLTFGLPLLDRTAGSVDRAFAILILGALAMSPLGWVYYLWVPVGPLIAILAQRERWHRFFLWPALPGLVLPEVTSFWSNWWLMITLGSAYTWTMLFLWLLVSASILRALLKSVAPPAQVPLRQTAAV